MENDSIVKIKPVADQVYDDRKEQSDRNNFLFLLRFEDAQFFSKVFLFNIFLDISLQTGLNFLDAPL